MENYVEEDYEVEDISTNKKNVSAVLAFIFSLVGLVTGVLGFCGGTFLLIVFGWVPVLPLISSIVSFIMEIVALVLGIAALILGIVGLKKSKSKKGFSITGIIIGSLMVLIALLMIIVIVVIVVSGVAIGGGIIGVGTVEALLSFL